MQDKVNAVAKIAADERKWLVFINSSIPKNFYINIHFFVENNHFLGEIAHNLSKNWQKCSKSPLFKVNMFR